MTSGNRPNRVSCALAALIATVLVSSASCGGSAHRAARTESASQLVARALNGRTGVASGRVELSLSLLAPGTGEAFTLHSAARFRIASAGAVPSLALTLTTLSRSPPGPERRLRVALVADAHGSSLSLQGRPVAASPQVQRALQAGYAQLVVPRGAGHRPVAPLGLDTAAWVLAPRFTPPAPAAPGGAVHIHAGLALAPFLADVGRLASLAAGLQRAAGPAGTSAPALDLSRAATGESGAGTVDLLAERRRGLPRSLAVRVTLHPRPGATGHPAPPVTISLKMGFTALGEPARAGAS